MSNSINYNYTLFEQAKLTPIRGKPTFETLHKLRNEIRANVKSAYSNLEGGSHDHLGIVLINAQFLLIYNMSFV